MSATTHVFRWDLDKTYLRSEFDSWRDLLKSALESPSDKQSYPGAAALLRTLRQDEGHRVCIVSGSPTQMHRVLSAKLALDGVEYDEFVLKDNLRNLLRGRFRALRSQVPYKLPTLLASRVALNATPPEVLFGDDAEADAIIYCMYADIIAGRISTSELEAIMRASRAYPDEIDHTLSLARRLVHQDSVRRILIHLDLRSPTALFAPFGARVVPIYNYFQAALVLYADGVLSARQVLFIAFEMLQAPEFALSTLANSLQDLIRRGRFAIDTARQLADEAGEAGEAIADEPVARDSALPPIEEIAEMFADRVRQLGGAAPLEWPAENPKLDYISLVDAEHDARRSRKRDRRSMT
ncbi:MAG: phosphatase domain-containing protein [Myxococcota bacterium]